MKQQNITEINRKAWNKIVTEGRIIHASKGGIEEKLLEFFIKSLPKDGAVLDIGCGTGIPVSKIIHDAGLKVTGIDISEEMVVKFKENLPQASCYRMPMTQINWESKFDGVVSSYSMLCLPPKDFVLVAGKISRALKENGWLLLFLNEGNSEEGGIQEVQGQQMYSTGLSEEEIRNVFEPNGIKIRKIERETKTTKEYGTENSIYLLMQKD
jgi:predicted TPR repeat methyltransferase